MKEALSTACVVYSAVIMLFFSYWWFVPGHLVQLALLLAAVVVSAEGSDPALSLSSERSSIERTYELTKYLEHQLREIKNTYLSYLGPPFSDPDFSPPRPNTTALSLPSAATRLDLWRGLENRARLAQNHRAYSVLLGAVRELARATLCPYLQSSLLHFSTGLDGLLGSISGLMTTLGYSLPLQYYSLPTGVPRAGLQEAELQGPEPIRVNLTRLLMDEILQNFFSNSNNKGSNNVANGNHLVSRENAQDDEPRPGWESHTQDKLELIRGKEGDREREDFPTFTSPPSLHPRHSRSLPSSLYTSTLHPPLSPLSLFYQFGAREGHTHLSDLAPGGGALSPPAPLLSSLSSTPLLHPPSLNDFSRKVESFWVLRELQSWLWRSAKDFNRLKKKLRS
ncbi:hypothetical protein COCON_G00120120 [Conger conger]|uniref:Cardiotrophin-like cytokine factor 1 n=1 Tax=Conger conger TaxID=82655 RepID=A0A9Q1DHH3_CONCO|nr:hypothetical protein COCON_G00120120 [Conger conger]